MLHYITSPGYQLAFRPPEDVGFVALMEAYDHFLPLGTNYIASPILAGPHWATVARGQPVPPEYDETITMNYHDPLVLRGMIQGCYFLGLQPTTTLRVDDWLGIPFQPDAKPYLLSYRHHSGPAETDWPLRRYDCDIIMPLTDAELPGFRAGLTWQPQVLNQLPEVSGSLALPGTQDSGSLALPQESTAFPTASIEGLPEQSLPINIIARGLGQTWSGNRDYINGLLKCLLFLGIPHSYLRLETAPTNPINGTIGIVVPADQTIVPSTNPTEGLVSDSLYNNFILIRYRPEEFYQPSVDSRHYILNGEDMLLTQYLSMQELIGLVVALDDFHTGSFERALRISEVTPDALDLIEWRQRGPLWRSIYQRDRLANTYQLLSLDKRYRTDSFDFIRGYVSGLIHALDLDSITLIRVLHQDQTKTIDPTTLLMPNRGEILYFFNLKEQ